MPAPSNFARKPSKSKTQNSRSPKTLKSTPLSSQWLIYGYVINLIVYFSELVVFVGQTQVFSLTRVNLDVFRSANISQRQREK